MSDDYNLLPCPFCGSDASFAHLGGLHWVHCDKCKGNTSDTQSCCAGCAKAFDTKEKAANAWNKRIRHESNEYLLEHFRQSGVFKCFECIYSKREETHLGNMYKCVHDGVLLHCGTKDEADIMRGCACFWFEPRAKAGEAVAQRQAAIMERVRDLLEFAYLQTPITYDGHTNEERRLERIRRDLQDLGVRL